MSFSDDPWELPSARAFIAEIAGAVAAGGGVIAGGSSMPSELDGALSRYFNSRDFVVERIEPVPGCQPAETVAKIFGAKPEAGALASEARLAEHLTFVLADGMDATLMNDWRLFLSRFIKERAKRDRGLAILLFVGDSVPRIEGFPVVAWGGRLRRIDVSIWADLHAPLDRPEPLATLAAALAVELCVWRLDLVAEIARARREDLLNPLGWLRSRSGQAAAPCRLNGLEMACPLTLREQGAEDDIHLRIWRAQVTALFPWIEAHRQITITRHRNLLRVDEHLHQLGVRDVDEIEFGALTWQLRGKISRTEAELIGCFSRLRNDLAHRKPVRPDDLDRALRETAQFDWRREAVWHRE